MAGTDLDDYFDGKTSSHEIFAALRDRIDGLGANTMTVGEQISFGVNRKFAWFWLYNITGKKPSGTPHLMLALDHPVDSPNVRTVAQIGKNRWNHQIVVRTLEDARSEWLGELLTEAYGYGTSGVRRR